MSRTLRKGSRIGKYRLDRRLGRGAFAGVWKARDTVENRNVALKVTHDEAVEEWGRAEIEHEARQGVVPPLRSLSRGCRVPSTALSTC